jgi:hypothetical protein
MTTANQEIIAELRRVLGERDEARAALAACPDCAMYAERSARFAEQADQMQRERDEARASVADAYRRGAEAMREACAAALLINGLVVSRERAAATVRALPIPEAP